MNASIRSDLLVRRTVRTPIAPQTAAAEKLAVAEKHMSCSGGPIRAQYITATSNDDRVIAGPRSEFNPPPQAPASDQDKAHRRLRGPRTAGAGRRGRASLHLRSRRGVRS